MTAMGKNDGHDNYQISCPQHPEFRAHAFEQKATVEVCRAHDRRFHPQVYVPNGPRTPSVRDLPRFGVSVAS